jgi:Zn finger protein HypA/HybF involved in hydrogenase expression
MAKKLTHDEYFKRLFEKFPENKKKFDYSKAIYKGTKKKFIIICNDCGNVFEQYAHNHFKGCGCQECKNSNIGISKAPDYVKIPRVYNKVTKNTRVYNKMTKVQYLEKLFLKFPENQEKFDYENSIYLGSLEDIFIKCNTCGNEFSQKASSHMTGAGCPICARDIMTTKTYIKKVLENNPENEKCFDYADTEYLGPHTKLKIFCKQCNEHFWQLPFSHINGHGHQKCAYKNAPALRTGRTKTSNMSNFLETIKGKHKIKYDYSKSVYVNSKIPIIIICECGHEFKQTPNNHMKGAGCPLCANKNKNILKKKSLAQFKIDGESKHPGRYNYDKVIYLGSFIPVTIYCNTCGRDFEQTPHGHLCGYGCPYCRFSKGEKLTHDILEKFIILFKIEYKDKTCRGKRLPLPFDFAIFNNEHELSGLIEYQGEHHFKYGYWSKNKIKNEKTFAERLRLDQIKRDWCKKSGIPLLELDYRKDDIIESKIWEFINTLNIF